MAGTLRAYLDELEADDLLTAHRKAHALQLATALDDSSKPHLWRGISTSLIEVLSLLDSGSPTDPEGDALGELMASFGGARRGRRGQAEVGDSA